MAPRRHRRWAYVRIGAGIAVAVVLIAAAVLLRPPREPVGGGRPVVLLPVISTALPSPATMPPR
ncbi:hypothetical protein [Nocardia blacklockiae]|uniref:hypothetical protein n=1 Tax=Nocardia blacklockiae TaxID=480036 RepID=UPI0018955E04|nr:hypothetical protein [Nocardia blacklockiae]MBF6174030.1 hypothetical protein [Nocardia blacklockiae]